MFKILKSRYRLKKKISIWYHPAYIPAIKSMASYERFSIKRAKKVLSTLRQKLLLFAGDLKNAPQASWNELELFHDSRYLTETTQNSKAFLPLGIQLDEEEQEFWIEAQRHMVGGTIQAAKALVNKKCKIAFNLGGGLHHAEPNYGTGFCLYNDIGVAIRVLRSENYQGKILIVDLDYHQGNGNMLGLKDDTLTYHYSLQGHEWREVQNPNIFQLNLPLHAKDAEYLPILEKTLQENLERIKPDLVFYIAGTDVLKHDYFGEFRLSLWGVFKRDRFVVESCKERRIPMLITLGGGYSDRAWESTYHLLRFLLTDEVPKNDKEKPTPSEKYYQRIARKMESNLLGKETDFEFSMDDLFPSSQQKSSSKAFGVYSKSGIDLVLERYGVKEKLKRKGHKNIQLELQIENDGSNLLRLYSVLNSEQHLILEAKLSTQKIKHPQLGQLRFMKIDWLLAQDPLRKFDKEKVALPGQKYPGLGLSQEIIQLLIQGCHRLGFDGISHTPTHFHIALKTCRDFRYLDPIVEGKLMALKSFLLPFSLAEASNLAEEKRILNPHGEPVWPFEGDIFFAISKKLIKYFESENYSNAVRKSYQQSFAEHWHVQ